MLGLQQTDLLSPISRLALTNASALTVRNVWLIVIPHMYPLLHPVCPVVCYMRNAQAVCRCCILRHQPPVTVATQYTYVLIMSCFNAVHLEVTLWCGCRSGHYWYLSVQRFVLGEQGSLWAQDPACRLQSQGCRSDCCLLDRGSQPTGSAMACSGRSTGHCIQSECLCHIACCSCFRQSPSVLRCNDSAALPAEGLL